MKEILNTHFIAVGSSSGMLADYCKRLLKSRNSKGVILKGLSPIECQKAEDWFCRCEKLFEEAERLANSGEDRKGLAFDDLKRRSLALADEIFQGGDRGCVFSRIASIFDLSRKMPPPFDSKPRKKCTGKTQKDRLERALKVRSLKKKARLCKPEAQEIHPNSILGLKSSRHWTIVADETGCFFDNKAFDTGGCAYYVFVVIPDYANLPKLSPGWHAVEQSPNSILEVAQNLLKSGCGIIGIPVQGLYPTNRQLWFACIETLLDIVLRTLPVAGRTDVVLNVEQRGVANAQNSELFEKTADDAMYHLSLVDPERAKNIHLAVKAISKYESPYNGYADLVAYSRGGSKDIRALLNNFGWVGPCLIPNEAGAIQSLRHCLDLVERNEVLPEVDWNMLLRCRDSRDAGSLTGALLRTFGMKARNETKNWNLYLGYVLDHLDSKAIRMSTLLPQIEWLKEYEPDAAQLPPRLRLLWLTAQLAESNHLGGTKFGTELHEREFVELCERLKDEDAPLTCFAALHLAVEKTDAFEFGVAREILKPWERERIAVPGLRYHAQVLSSLGQHAAFLGDNEKALEYFLKAMDEFRHLSADWQRDFDQTCAYAVIAAMDANSPDLERLMSLYLYGGEWSEETMVDMAHQFAAVGEDEPDSKYAHAILLRYLVTLPADNPIRSTYLADSAKWQWSEDGHPWELIAFYRALLLSQDDPARREWLQKGYNLCANSGPTLRAIAAVILGALLYDGATKRDEYMAKVEEVISLLPNLGKARASALLAHADKPIPPLELAAKVLPFNFR